MKYCLEHIIRNVVHKFKIGKDKSGRLRTILSVMQVSFKLGVGVWATDNLNLEFGNETGRKIMVYLMSIHSQHWVVFAKDI
jgi:hypothetical protein